MWKSQDWLKLSEVLESDLSAGATRKTIRTGQGHIVEYDEMKASRSKSHIDKIDLALATAYGLDDEETDFIINYDIKYRMGGADDEGGE
jgi:hypothetical protein